MLSRTFRSFRVASYRWYAAASLITNTAMWMQRITQDWLAVHLTGNGVAVGITTALQFLPALLVGPFAGSLADRLPRRALLVMACVAMAIPSFLLGAIVASGAVTIWYVYGFALALGLASAVDSPVRSAYIRDLMSEDDLVNAIGLSGVIFHTSRIIGPAVAGFLIAAAGVSASFVAVGLAYLAAVGVLFRIQSSHVLADDVAHPHERPGLAGVVGLLRAQPGLIVLMLLSGVVSAFAGNFQVALTIMATKAFKLGASQFGNLTSMMAIGSIVGAFLVARLHKPSYLMVFSAAGALGLAYLLASGAQTAFQFGLILLPIGLLSNMYLSTSNAVVQLRVPPRFQGRVAGLYGAGAHALVPGSAILIGYTADHWAPRVPLAAAGLVCVLGAIATCAALLTLGIVEWRSGRIVEVQKAPAMPAPFLGAPVLDDM